MKYKDITLFISQIEDLLQSIGFDYKRIDDCYLASYGIDKVIIIPHMDDVEFEVPNEYFRNKKVIISSSLENDGNNFLTISELKNLVNKRKELGKAYNQLIKVLFFDYKVTSLIEYIIEKPLTSIPIKDELDNTNLKELETNNNDSKVDISIVEKALSIRLEKKKKYYSNNDYGIVAIISKLYPTKNYWYGYHDYQIKILKTFNKPYIAFYFKDRKSVLLLPLVVMEEYRAKLNSTTNKRGIYWHIFIRFRNGKCLWQIPNNGFLDVTEYLINESENEQFNVIEKDNSKNNKNEVIIKIRNTIFHEAKVKK